MHVSRTITEITASPDVVFDYAATPNNWPEFWPLTLSVSGAVAAPLAQGDRCIEQARILGWRGSFHWQVVESARPSRLVMQGYSQQEGRLGALAPENQSQIAYTLTPSTTGTRFEREMTYADSNLLVKFADWVGFGREIDRLTAIAMRALQAILDNRRLQGARLDPTAPELLTQADRMGDAAVASLVERDGNVDAARRLLGQIYSGSLNVETLPAGPVRDFFEQTGTLPPWVDPDRLALAEEVFLDWGLLTISSLACASLPESYALPGIARVLDLTGELDVSGRYAHRRLLFTTRMVLDVMRRGGLAPGGVGVRATQRIRLLHALVRHLLGHRVDAAGQVQASPSSALWGAGPGVPINQIELAYTLQTFGWVILRSLDRFDCELTPFQQESYLHAWNVVGWLLGIHQGLLPATVAEAKQQFGAIHLQYIRSTPEAVRLGRTLVDFWAGLFPFGTRWAARRLMQHLVFTLVSEDTRAIVGLESLPAFPRIASLVMSVVGRTQAHITADSFASFPLLASAASRFTQLGLGLATRRDERLAGLFDIPEELARRWARL